MTLATCPACGSENRDNAKFCDGCGAKLGLAIAEAQPSSPQGEAEDEGLSPPADEGEGVVESDSSGTMEVFESTEPEAEPVAEVGADLAEAEDEAEATPAEATEAEADVQEEVQEEVQEDAPEEETEGPPKTGYLIFPDHSEQPIPPSQWLIGRAELSKFVSDPGKVNEISRGHLTVFQEGNRFFVEDGTTMVQRKASANKTWLVRNGSRTLVTGTGRTELQDADEIDVAELVTLQFVLR